MKLIEAHIMGQTSMLACPEGSEEHMEQSVQRVDDAMCKIRDAGKIRARDRVAVLAALNIALDLVERERNAGPVAGSGSAPASAPIAPEGDVLRHPRMQSLLRRMEELLAEDGKLL
jgi:cell division protein ZapA